MRGAHGGARVIALTSASSKTALGLASLLSAERRGGRRVVGLTSPGNAAFVRHTGYYDEVVTYDALDALPANDPTVLVDFAGNGGLLERVHRHLGDRLAYSSRVGVTHWDQMTAPGELPGPAPVFFFAPTQVAKRMADWGAAEFQRRAGTVLRRFIASSVRWLRIVEGRGPAAVEAVYRAMVDGRVDPSGRPHPRAHALRNVATTSARPVT